MRTGIVSLLAVVDDIVKALKFEVFYDPVVHQRLKYLYEATSMPLITQGLLDVTASKVRASRSS